MFGSPEHFLHIPYLRIWPITAAYLLGSVIDEYASQAGPIRVFLGPLCVLCGGTPGGGVGVGALILAYNLEIQAAIFFVGIIRTSGLAATPESLPASNLDQS